MFLLLHRVKYWKKVPLGTGTEFQVPIPVPNPNSNHPFLFSPKTCDAVLNSLLLSVLAMIFVSFSDTFNASTQPTCLLHYKECVPLTILWLLFDRVTKNVIVRYNLFCLFAYLFIFCHFRPNNLGCRTFGASLVRNGTSADVSVK